MPQLEAAGIVVRTAGAWRSGRPPRPQVRVTVGGKASARKKKTVTRKAATGAPKRVSPAPVRKRKTG